MHPFSGEVKTPVAAGKKNLGSQIQTGMTNFGMPKPEMSLVLPLPIIPSLHVTGNYFIPASLGREIQERFPCCGEGAQEGAEEQQVKLCCDLEEGNALFLVLI